MPAPAPHVSQLVHEASQVSEARRTAQRLASRAGFDEVDAGRVTVITSELAQNLLKHTPQGGELLLRTYGDEHPGFEIIAVDKGPGMNVAVTMQDGYSTAGTAGTGLGAVRRMSQFVDVYSTPQHGTAVVVQLWTKKGEPAEPKHRIGVVSVPIRGESVCGDSWCAMDFGGRFLAMIVDGLGHGQGAAEAAAEAVAVMEKEAAHAPGDILDAAHLALRKTRGAAMSVYERAYSAKRARFSGIGNISASLWSAGKSQSMVSHNGTLGAEIRRTQEFEYDVAPNAVLVMHSDGLNTSWDLNRYPGLQMRHPALIAAVLYRDHKRGRDDATVLVAKEKGLDG